MTKDSAVYRGVKTVLQVAGAILAFLLVSDDFRTLVSNHPTVAIYLSLLGGVISIVQNVLDSDIPNI